VRHGGWLCAGATHAEALAHHVSAGAALQTCQVSADLDYAQVPGRLAPEPQTRVRIAGRRTDDGLRAYTMLTSSQGRLPSPHMGVPNRVVHGVRPRRQRHRCCL